MSVSVHLCPCVCVCVCVCVYGRAYQRTLEKGGGGGGVPSCTCDDIRDQGVIHALPQREGRGRGQRVLQVPRPGGRDPRRRGLLTCCHLVHHVQRPWGQQLPCRDTMRLHTHTRTHTHTHFVFLFHEPLLKQGNTLLSLNNSRLEFFFTQQLTLKHVNG